MKAIDEQVCTEERPLKHHRFEQMVKRRLGVIAEARVHRRGLNDRTAGGDQPHVPILTHLSIRCASRGKTQVIR